MDVGRVEVRGTVWIRTSAWLLGVVVVEAKPRPAIWTTYRPLEAPVMTFLCKHQLERAGSPLRSLSHGREEVRYAYSWSGYGSPLLVMHISCSEARSGTWQWPWSRSGEEVTGMSRHGAGSGPKIDPLRLL